MNPARNKLMLPLALLLVSASAAFAAAHDTAAPSAASEEPAARYTDMGELIAPLDYRDWVFLTSGVNMNYSDQPSGMNHDMVDNVFVDPTSWKAFKETGRWPDGTVFVKEGRVGSSKGSINKSGVFQTESRFDLEVHVLDSRRFGSGGGFFVNAEDKPAKVLPAKTSCYSCHTEHGAVQSTFVQFYPTARPIAVKAGTFDAGK